jgi:hypothetical protein
MKLTYYALILATIFTLGFSCGQTLNETRIKPGNNDTIQNRNSMTNYFPFKIRDNEGHFVIVAETESSELYPKYASFFEKHQYSGNGYCWEGHIIQILEKLNPDLLKHIDFDPEAGAFFAYADTKENQLKFVELLSPIFSDLNKLEKYVSQADRSEIDD